MLLEIAIPKGETVTKKRHPESDSDDDLELPKDASGLNPFERLQLEIQVAAADPANQEDDPELEITPLEMEWYRWQAKKAWFGGASFFIGWFSLILGFCIFAILEGFRSSPDGRYFVHSTQDVLVASIFALLVLASGFLLFWTQIFPKTPVKDVINGVAEQVTKGGIELEGMFVLRPPSAPPIQSNRKYTGEGFYVEKKIGGCILPTKLNGWELTQRDITISKTKGMGWYWLLGIVPQGIWPFGFSNLKNFENLAFSKHPVIFALYISSTIYFTLLFGAIVITMRSIILGIKSKRNLKKR